MCLPFSCGGGGDRGDHGSPVHPGFPRQPPRPTPHRPVSRPPRYAPSSDQPPPLSASPRYFPSSEQDDPQAYKTFAVTPPFDEAYGQHRPGMMAAGGKGMNGGAEAAPRHHVAGVTKNNGERMMAFDDNPYASIRGRKSGAENVVVAPALPAQAPHQRKDVYYSASPLHGRPVTAAPHQKEHTEKMRAPAVVQMARRGGEDDDYPAVAATTTMMPAANNLYNDRGHAYGDEGNRKPHGNIWW